MQLLRRSLLRIVAMIAGRPLPPQTSVRRVLVVKPDHLGDVLLLTPALRELRVALPEAHIALMIGPWSAAAVRGNPTIDALLFCAFPGFTRQPKPGLLQPYTLLLRTALLLRAGHYDTGIIARDDHWWGALLALVAGIPRRIGYAAPDVAPLLTEALPYDPHAHVTVQALDLVAHLADHAHLSPAQHPTRNTQRPTLPDSQLPPPGSRPPPPRMYAPIAPDDEHWAKRWLEAHGYDPHRQLVAIHPGAGGQAKLWIAARWASVADALAADGWQVVLTGGAGERALVEDVAGRLAQPPVLLVGETSLGELAAFYRHCDLVLGVDSGPLHLATAVGAPTVVLFGPIDHRRFRSWGPPERHRIVRSGLWCSPCGVPEACPRGTSPSECMTTITVTQVLATASALTHSDETP